VHPKKILIVEDEQKIADVIASYLQNAGYETVIANDGEEGLKLYSKEHPDLVVLDLMLPGLSGEEVCKAIRATDTTPIIMLTAKAAEDEIIGGLNLGADDYVIKPFSPRQLMARVETVLRRSTMVSNATGLVINRDKRDVMVDGISVNLTPIEYKLLETLAKFSEKTYTRDELVCFVLGDDYDGYDRTIDTHIKNLRAKIEKDPKNPKIILTVHGVGYRFGGWKT